MSKQKRPIFFILFIFALILQFSNTSFARESAIKIKIESLAPAVIEIQGESFDAESEPNARNFSFLQTYAGIENLAERVFDLSLYDRNKQKIEYKKLNAGEFLAEKPFRSWSYKLKADISTNLSSMAHVSWISGEEGILMTSDLLPQNNAEAGKKAQAKISFELPKNWRISSTEKRSGENTFEVTDAENAIFYVGKSWREKEMSINNSALNVIISGERQFSDEEAFEMAREIFDFYEKLFAAPLRKNARIFLGKFPGDAKNGRWQAETRGSNITIISAEMPFKTQSVQRLHEQMRHEIFHLRMPNDLNLSGNYDWFYEGFALYQALRAGVAVNRLRFEDFLDTLARAHSIDSMQTQRISLLEASKNRWNGANTQIYARGMLVAFLCDVSILRKTGGKNSLSEVFRQIYRQHSYPNARQDGNAAVLSVLQAREELRSIVEKYIKGSENIVWRTDLEAVGIETSEENFQTKLTVKAKPNGRQKDLLDELGYNNWRKLRKVQNEN
jgi:predicted metalloprotease with PDZ domain